MDDTKTLLGFPRKPIYCKIARTTTSAPAGVIFYNVTDDSAFTDPTARIGCSNSRGMYDINSGGVMIPESGLYYVQWCYGNGGAASNVDMLLYDTITQATFYKFKSAAATYSHHWSSVIPLKAGMKLNFYMSGASAAQDANAFYNHATVTKLGELP